MTIAKQKKSNHKYKKLVYITNIFILLITTACSADRVGSYQNFKQDALGPLASRYDQIIAVHKDDGALETFLRRVNLIDTIANLLVKSFESTRSDSLDSLLGDIVDISDAHRTSSPIRAMRAAEILSEYTSHFTKTISFSLLTKEEIAFLRNYYDTLAKMAGEFIAQRGKMVSAINKQSGVDILELCMVMPFLHLSDQQWTAENIKALPKWMKTGDNIAALEEFALRVRRPFTAYQFSLFNRNSGTSDKDQEFAYSEYLLAAVESRIKHRDYHVAIHCIRIGIEQAEQAKKQETAVKLHFRLSDLLTNIGHPDLAAKKMLKLMKSYPKCLDWGKAAMLRIKYLYEAADFKTIASEADKYKSDSRCNDYLAQILYISWVTHRRLNDPETAQKLKQQFLKRYSKHPLGADMYFASAMTAMASGDYEEADRLLEIVEYQYPKSRIQQKVKKIRERLEKTSGGKPNG